MMRVLHVVGGMDRAGAETMIMNVYRAIDRDRVQFDFLYFTDRLCAFDDEILGLGGRIFRIPLSRWQVVQREAAVWGLLRAHPEITCVHGHTDLSIAGHLTAARMAGVPVRIAHSHLAPDTATGGWGSRLHHAAAVSQIRRMATHRIACGTEAALHLFDGKDPALILPNAVDLGRFTGIGSEARALLRAELRCDEGTLVLVQVGTLNPRKNQLLSLRVAKELAAQGLQVVLLLAGTGPDESILRATASGLGGRVRVELLGERADIPELLAASDVLLMPSLREGFPVTLVEAQAAGIPAVVSTSITAEVDLGLGLVRRVPVSATPAVWAAAVHLSAGVPRPAPDLVETQLRARGYSAEESARTLTELYTGA